MLSADVMRAGRGRDRPAKSELRCHLGPALADLVGELAQRLGAALRVDGPAPEFAEHVVGGGTDLLPPVLELLLTSIGEMLDVAVARPGRDPDAPGMSIDVGNQADWLAGERYLAVGAWLLARDISCRVFVCRCDARLRRI